MCSVTDQILVRRTLTDTITGAAPQVRHQCVHQTFVNPALIESLLFSRGRFRNRQSSFQPPMIFLSVFENGSRPKRGQSHSSISRTGKQLKSAGGHSNFVALAEFEDRSNWNSTGTTSQVFVFKLPTSTTRRIFDDWATKVSCDDKDLR